MTDIYKNDFNKIIKELSNKMPYVKVGVLGEHANRIDGKMNNADVGLIHEFGSKNAPMRSFLRMPLGFYLNDKIRSSDYDGKMSISDSLYRIGAIAQAICQESFLTEGFGTWRPSQKSEGRTLVDTGQLMNSIKFEVVE